MAVTILQYPKKVKFYLCDDIKAESPGKPWLLGLFSDDVVLVNVPGEVPEPSEKEPIVIQGLAILATLIDCKGPFSVRVKLTGPRRLQILKDQVVDPKADPTPVGKYRNMNFVVKVAPFKVPAFGKYEFVISLNNKSFPFEFTIVRGVKPTTSPTLFESPKSATRRRTIRSSAP